MKRIIYTMLLVTLFFAQEADKKFTVGLGIGLEYAVLGVKTSYEHTGNLESFLSLGTVPLKKKSLFTYTLGLNLYLFGKDDKFRLYGTALFGTTTVIQKLFSDEADELRNGLTLGFGLRWLWGESKRFGMKFALHKIIDYGISAEEEKNYEVLNDSLKPNLGFCFRF